MEQQGKCSLFFTTFALFPKRICFLYHKIVVYCTFVTGTKMAYVRQIEQMWSKIEYVMRYLQGYFFSLFFFIPTDTSDGGHKRDVNGPLYLWKDASFSHISPSRFALQGSSKAEWSKSDSTQLSQKTLSKPYRTFNQVTSNPGTVEAPAGVVTHLFQEQIQQKKCLHRMFQAMSTLLPVLPFLCFVLRAEERN